LKSIAVRVFITEDNINEIRFADKIFIMPAACNFTGAHYGFCFDSTLSLLLHKSIAPGTAAVPYGNSQRVAPGISIERTTFHLAGFYNRSGKIFTSVL